MSANRYLYTTFYFLSLIFDIHRNTMDTAEARGRSEQAIIRISEARLALKGKITTQIHGKCNELSSPEENIQIEIRYSRNC
jgi:hypothetical protein